MKKLLLPLIAVALLFSCEKESCHTFLIEKNVTFFHGGIEVHEDVYCPKYEFVCNLTPAEVDIFIDMNTITYTTEYDGIVIVGCIIYNDGIIADVVQTCRLFE